MGVILTMTMVMMTGLAMTRERERGTMENLLAMPAQPLEVMTGKIVPYIFIGLVQATIILLAALYLFGVPFVGSVVVLYAVSLLFIAANLTVGITISSLAQNQLQAMQLTFFYFLPTMLLSGLHVSLPWHAAWAQWIGNVLPATYFMRLVRGILLKGNEWADLWPNIWPLMVFTVVMMTHRDDLLPQDPGLAMKRALFACLATAAIAACSSDPLRPPEIPVAAATRRRRWPARHAAAGVHGGDAQQLVAGRDIPAQWWTLFRSPALDALVRRALDDSPTLARAQARLRQAQEDLSARSGATELPQRRRQALRQPRRRRTRNRWACRPCRCRCRWTCISPRSACPTPSTSLGGTRRELEGLRAEVDHQRYELEAARLMLAGNVVTTAIREASLREQIANTRRSSRCRRASWRSPSGMEAARRRGPRRRGRAAARAGAGTRRAAGPAARARAGAPPACRVRRARRPARRTCPSSAWPSCSCRPNCR